MDMKPTYVQLTKKEMTSQAIITYLRRMNPRDPELVNSFSKLVQILSRSQHHIIFGVFARRDSNLPQEFIYSAAEFSNIKFVYTFNVEVANALLSEQETECHEKLEGVREFIAILRTPLLIKRHVKAIEGYDNDTYGSLNEFIKKQFLIDVDFYTPSTQMLYY
jgi:hypothetical protein